MPAGRVEEADAYLDFLGFPLQILGLNWFNDFLTYSTIISYCYQKEKFTNQCIKNILEKFNMDMEMYIRILKKLPYNI